TSCEVSDYTSEESEDRTIIQLKPGSKVAQALLEFHGCFENDLPFRQNDIIRNGDNSGLFPGHLVKIIK
ncbi:hypothetical protein LSH36_55g09066, partial [Paralvinella palmiformis]